ncbi:MAG TPA: hypothetical protein VMH27_19995 [Puia sp.]|nr:hypothetical protein [Puia sp.]
MKYHLTILAISSTLSCFGQTGNPVFNSIPVGQDSLGGCKLLANYYTLQNNIDNKTTSVYISDKPTIDEVAKAATNLPADFFILVRNNQILKLILVNNYPEKWILVSTPGDPEPRRYKNPLKGDIAENRANELIKARYDSSASISNGKLNFNGKRYRINTNQQTREVVIDLIEREHFDTLGSSAVTLLTKEELHKMILEQTKEGGRLDFFTPIKGREMQGIQIKPGVFDTRIGMALYQWGKSCFDMGVVDVDEAYAIFGDFKGRPVNMREQSYIKLGFDKALEK